MMGEVETLSHANELRNVPFLADSSKYLHTLLIVEQLPQEKHSEWLQNVTYRVRYFVENLMINLMYECTAKAT